MANDLEKSVRMFLQAGRDGNACLEVRAYQKMEDAISKIDLVKTGGRYLFDYDDASEGESYTDEEWRYD